MRRQLAVSSNTVAQDLESIQTVELLGEGTFGKVRAVWRARQHRRRVAAPSAQE